MQKHKNNIDIWPFGVTPNHRAEKTGVLRWGWQQLKLTRCFTMRFDSNIMATYGYSRNDITNFMNWTMNESSSYPVLFFCEIIESHQNSKTIITSFDGTVHVSQAFAVAALPLEMPTLVEPGVLTAPCCSKMRRCKRGGGRKGMVEQWLWPTTFGWWLVQGLHYAVLYWCILGIIRLSQSMMVNPV